MIKILLHNIIIDFAISNFFEVLNKNFPPKRKLHLDPNELSVGTFVSFYVAGTMRQIRLDARVEYINDTDGMIALQSVYDTLPIFIFVMRDSVYNVIGAGSESLYDYVGR
jgi:hypothetical protein